MKEKKVKEGGKGGGERGKKGVGKGKKKQTNKLETRD